MLILYISSNSILLVFVLTNQQGCCLGGAMKQVARKSTTSVPPKVSTGSHQLNGLVRESSAQKTSASATSNVSSALTNDASSEIVLDKDTGNENKDVHLANGIHDSCEQVLRNGAGHSNLPNSRSKTTAAAATAAGSVQQQTVEHSAGTSGKNLPVVPGNASRSTLSQTASKTDNSKDLKDVSVPVKCVASETTKTSHTTSVAASVNSPHDVITVQDDVTVDIKSGADSTKRPVSPADQKKCKVKKARLDSTIGQSAQVEESFRLSRKVYIVFFCF